jgi:RNA polymerase sigma-70 factor (ECF subfamily)
MTEHDDHVFVRQCLAGDREAFGVLVGRHQKAVFNVALRMTRNFQEAQDITQAVFIKAYEKLDGYDARHKFFSWIYRMAVNEALNFIKRDRRFAGLETAREYATMLRTPEGEYEENETSRHVHHALMLLKVDHRAIIILKHFQELSYHEIGYILDLPEKTVKSRLFTARQLLKQLLLKQGYVEND